MAADPKAQETPTPKPDLESVKIFSYPKIIFIWPTMVFALICGIGMLIVGDAQPETSPPVAEEAQVVEADGAEAQAQAELTPPKVRRFSSWQNIFGVIFLIVFGVNMMVMSLDFPRFTLIAVIFFILMIVFLMLYLASQGVDFLSPLTYLSRHLYFTANAGFYFAISAILAVMFAVIWMTRYLDYWEVRSNEVLHHHGPLSDLERFPTLQLKFTKEIPDVLEFLLGLGSGRLVLYFSATDRQVVLDHVLFINSKEEQLKQIMSKLRVDE
ncbi:hypothetical protein [Tautonia sociabilis]|uniref:Uncharacterized protein n=1 Tax=Tautonia sociabilis TaxID=2080755 RepID=A0A432MR53_9BACT|nr:hypothetical protein [Tautonia sociabilis]RUL89418.1 hypothetical protein TsocGM_01205 [Tautonia sociabilis]